MGRRIYLQTIDRRYRQASRAGKGVILDEFCSICGYNRKYGTHTQSPTSSFIEMPCRQEADLSW